MGVVVIGGGGGGGTGQNKAVDEIVVAATFTNATLGQRYAEMLRAEGMTAKFIPYAQDVYDGAAVAPLPPTPEA